MTTAIASEHTPAAISDALLRAWERWHGAGPIERALGLLDAVWPHYGHERWSRLSIGDRDSCLFLLQASLFGAGLRTLATCPACGECLESRFAVDDVCALPTLWPQPRELLELRHAKYRIRYRLPCSADLLALAAPAHAATPLSTPLSDPVTSLLRRCVVEVECGGQTVDAAQLPQATQRRLGEAMSGHDPVADLRLRVNCPACGHAWSAALDIAAYVWEELDDWAQDLLSEVHVLARNYAWSERDILAMTPLRRRYYLDLLHA